jgi:hypothetical protein
MHFEQSVRDMDAEIRVDPDPANSPMEAHPVVPG